MDGLLLLYEAPQPAITLAVSTTASDFFIGEENTGFMVGLIFLLNFKQRVEVDFFKLTWCGSFYAFDALIRLAVFNAAQ